jgi:hypothetical protein
MSVSYRIFPDLGLVYVRYQGFARVADTERAFAAYSVDPDCRLGQKQLVDLREVSGFERDYPKLMQLQARKAELFATQGVETLVVYLVSSAETRDMVRTALRAWDGIDGLVALMQTDEAEALHLLGQPEDTIRALLEKVG